MNDQERLESYAKALNEASETAATVEEERKRARLTELRLRQAVDRLVEALERRAAEQRKPTDDDAGR